MSIILKPLYDSGLQKVIIPINSIDVKDMIIEHVKMFIKYDIVNIQIDIRQNFESINQMDIYQDFIIELIECSNGLTDITFRKDLLSTYIIESLPDFNDLYNTIEYENWLLHMNKKIQSEQKKLYHRISLEHRHRIILLAKYGIISQLYMSTVHKSNSVKYLNNKFIYFSYKIKDDLLDYNPVIFSRIYFDNLKNTHVFTDVDLYTDKNELIYNEKHYNIFMLLLSRLPVKEILIKLDSCISV